MSIRLLAGTLLCFSLFAFHCRAQSTPLNLSHDLITRGIASVNMTPGQPSLDSRPLLESAIVFAQANGIANLIADPGSYYFLSRHNPNTHVLINGASNLRLDFQNSDLFFAFRNIAAVQCNNCSNTTMNSSPSLSCAA